nr:nitrilase-related carbon-nitrogen hydrolase [uncultured Sphaerochaeta sp.]
MESYKTATVQFQHIPSNKEANLEIIAAYVDEARKSGVRLIAFPEMCITGYWHVRNLSREEIQVLAEPVPNGPSTQKLVNLATKTKMTIGAGLIELAENGALYLMCTIQHLCGCAQ